MDTQPQPSSDETLSMPVPPLGDRSDLEDLPSTDKRREADPHGRSPSSGSAGHVVLFIVALVVWVAAGVGLAILLADVFTEDLFLSQEGLDAGTRLAGIIAALASVIYAIGTMGAIATRVGYRFRDGLFMLVPIYSWVLTVKMLWRWTALPDQYWDVRSDDDAPEGVARPVGRRRPAALPVGILSVAVVVGALVYGAVDSGGPTSRTDAWRTTSVGGMSLELPASFQVSTDPAEFARSAAEVGHPAADEAAEFFREFPQFFVMAALELPPDAEAGSLVDPLAAVTVLKFPSAGMTLEEASAGFLQGMEEQGLFELVSQRGTIVGARDYDAVRVESETGQLGSIPALRSVAYLVNESGVLWIVEFESPPERYEDDLEMFERGIASLTLP